MENQKELTMLLGEFKETYLDTINGEYHRSQIIKAREEGKANYEKALQIEKEGKDITDFVLYGFLPYNNTKNNREKGHWIHVAPAIIKDAKTLFEGAGWPSLTILMRQFPVPS